MLIKEKRSVIIAGAGPVGLLIAIRLGREGISTLVLEKNDTLPRTLRAIVNNPVVLRVLSKCDVLDAVMKEAYVTNEGITWQDSEGNRLAQLNVPNENPDQFGGVMLIGQARMNDILLEEVKKYPSVKLIFGARCTGVEDLPSSEKVLVMTWQRSNGEQDICYEADYVVGADGAASSVRRTLCVPFEGYTMPDWKVVSTHVQYDFATENGLGPLTSILDPTDWAMILLTGEDAQGRGCSAQDSVWRVSYGEDPSLPSSKETVMQRAVERVAKYTKPGVPFKVVNAEPYYLHQRCAAQARKGRVVLAGDALHVNNPCGGLGLTTGIVDAFCYGNALVRVIKDGEPDSLLTECADSRRDAFLKITNPTSIMNFKRDTYSQDEDAVKFRTGFFHKMNTDPNFSIELRKKVDMMLSRSFEREEHEASSQNGVMTGNTAETTTGAAAEAPQQGRFAREQNGVGPELTREATAETAVEGPEQGKVASEQNGVGRGVSEQTEIARGSGEQSKIHEQEDQIQVGEENRVDKEHGVNGGVDGENDVC